MLYHYIYWTKKRRQSHLIEKLKHVLEKLDSFSKVR